jgi:hypothetical protein
MKSHTIVAGVHAQVTPPAAGTDDVLHFEVGEAGSITFMDAPDARLVSYRDLRCLRAGGRASLVRSDGDWVLIGGPLHDVA